MIISLLFMCLKQSDFHDFLLHIRIRPNETDPTGFDPQHCTYIYIFPFSAFSYRTMLPKVF